jgi:predicted O-methyltransferase YrrM
MNQATWTQVDAYLCDRLMPGDHPLDECLRASAEAGLPAINVSPTQGKLLMMLAKLRGATSILEVGTLGGYSTIWLARALKPGGRLISLEIDPARAELARANLDRAGFTHHAEVRVGPAAGALAAMVAGGDARFDFIFIDADKKSTCEYFERAVQLATPGAVIVVDNVVRSGGVADPTSTDPDVQGVRRFIDRLSSEPGITATAIQTVGGKGYDGLLIATVD